MVEDDSIIEITSSDLRGIKDLSQRFFNESFAKGLDSKDIQILLIVQGFIQYIGSKGVKIPVKVDFKK